MTEAFYRSLGENRFAPTPHTAGPWTPDAQHFGPPSGLLVRALENLPAPRPSRLARVTVEILGPAPLTELAVRSTVERPGRSVELLSAELIAGDRAVARASAWRMSTSDTEPIVASAVDPLPPPEKCPAARWPETWIGGFVDATEWRSVAGSMIEPGPAVVWGRQTVPLLEDEPTSPLQRLFAIADCGNGVSNFLDAHHWWFINTELTVHLLREPEGEWIGLDATTLAGPHGVGTATSRLHDHRGQVATGAQALLVRPR